MTVPALRQRTHPGIRVHRSRCLDARDLRRRDGILVTSAARTALDVAAALSQTRLRRFVRQAQADKLVNVRQLTEILGRSNGRRGAAALAAIVASGPAPTRSELEDIVLDLILSGGFAHPDVNLPLTLDGRRVVPDFRWPNERLVLEADGAAWHDGKLAREDDAQRQALLEADGDRVLRVTWDQALLKRSQTLVRLGPAGAPRAGWRAVGQLRSLPAR